MRSITLALLSTLAVATPTSAVVLERGEPVQLDMQVRMERPGRTVEIAPRLVTREGQAAEIRIADDYSGAGFFFSAQPRRLTGSLMRVDLSAREGDRPRTLLVRPGETVHASLSGDGRVAVELTATIPQAPAFPAAF